MSEKMLVIAAHVGDFVWRSAGSIAKYVNEGNEVDIIALSNGLVGEAAEYWKREGANWEEGAKIRRDEGAAAAEILLRGTGKYTFLDWKDHPLVIDHERLETLITLIRESKPDFVVTHDRMMDAFNPDHGYVSEAVRQASCFARSTGRMDGLGSVGHVIPLYGMEPQNPDLSGFVPGCYIDITESMDLKREAMQAIKSQSKMFQKYVAKAEVRGLEASARCGCKGCKYAEAFSMFGPVGSTGRFVW